MTSRFLNWHEARNHAQARANRDRLDVAIRGVREYGHDGYNVSLASRNDSDYARAEIVRPEALTPPFLLAPTEHDAARAYRETLAP